MEKNKVEQLKQSEVLERLASKYQSVEEGGNGCGSCAESCNSGANVLEELITPDPNSDLLPEDLSETDIAQILNDSPPIDDADPSKLQINFEGYKKSVTGVVKILRINGSEDHAGLLEDFAALAEASKKFFRAKRRATATSHRAVRRSK